MRLSVIIIFLLLLEVVHSQSTFSKTYYSSEDSRASRVKEDLNGNYIVSGSKVMNSNLFKPFVYKMDCNGNIIDSALYFEALPYDMYIEDVVFSGCSYIFIGFTADYSLSSAAGPNDSSMFYIRTDTNLNIIDTAFYSVTSNEDVEYSTTKIDVNGNIIIAGHYSNTGFFGSFIYKLSANGDSLASAFVPIDSVKLFKNIMIDSNYYYALSMSFKKGYSQLYKYDTNLVLRAIYNISNLVGYQYSPIWVNDSTYYTSGVYNEAVKMDFSIVKVTIEGELLDSLIFGSDSVDNYSGFYDALCKQNGSLYYVGNIYKNLALPPYGNNEPTEIYLAKIDTNLNIIWEKYMGGDAYYTATNVIATSDGSVLLLATRNDITDNLNQLDIYLAKVDSDGNVAWTKNINIPKQSISIYPNPATNIINIALKSQNQQISQLSIIDIQGRVVQQEMLNDKQTKIDVSLLPKGVYIIEGYTDRGERFGGKFVKE